MLHRYTGRWKRATIVHPSSCGQPSGGESGPVRGFCAMRPPALQWSLFLISAYFPLSVCTPLCVTGCCSSQLFYTRRRESLAVNPRSRKEIEPPTRLLFFPAPALSISLFPRRTIDLEHRETAVLFIACTYAIWNSVALLRFYFDAAASVF